MPKLHALFDCSPAAFTPGGTRTYVQNLAEALQQLSPERDVQLAFSQLPSELKPDGKKGPRHQLKVALWESYYLHRLLPSRARSADVLHAPALRFPFMHNGRMIVTVLDVIPLIYPQLFRRRDLLIFRLYTSQLSRRAAHVVTISEQSRQDIHRLLGIPLDRITSTPLGVAPCFRAAEPSVIGSTLKQYGIARPYLLTVGTLEPRKNLRRTLEAFAALKHDHVLPHQLVVVGPRGWRLESVMQIAQRLHVGTEVHVTGQVPLQDLVALYSGAVALLYPSLWEGFGLPPLEAMACGCPVITSNISAMPEVVGSAGLLVDPYDVHTITNAALRLVTDSDLARTLRAQGLDRAAMFTWRRCAEQTLNVYHQVTGK